MSHKLVFVPKSREPYFIAAADGITVLFHFSVDTDNSAQMQSYEDLVAQHGDKDVQARDVDSYELKNYEAIPMGVPGLRGAA